MASKVCDEKSSNTYYQSVDHLGSTNVLTDDKGEFYEHIETFPDGSIWVKEFVDQSGVNATYTNYEMDVETKLFYAWARYYDAQLGRFISVDPIIGSYLPTGDRKRDANMPGYGGFYNPVNINMYSYGANNPLKFVDPDGERIVLSSTATKKEIREYQRARKYIRKTKRGRALFDKLERSKKIIITIHFIDTKNLSYWPRSSKAGDVYWNEHLGKRNGDQEKISPAITLSHELGHGEQHLMKLLKKIMAQKRKSRKEKILNVEHDNMIRTEKPIAKELGEGVRKNYFDNGKDFVSPNSTNKGYQYKWGDYGHDRDRYDK